MNSFRFPLEKVLDWRRTQLDLAEARLQRQMAALAALDRAHAELEASGVRAEVEVRQWNPLDGRDLAALGRFRLMIRAREKQIAAERAGCLRNLQVLKAAMLEARRRCRLLERLKECRLAEWTAARDREVEEVAAEAFLARWNREHHRPAVQSTPR